MTNWEKYFGTPEKTAEMRVKFICFEGAETCGIAINNKSWDGIVVDKDNYLEWLNREAE